MADEFGMVLEELLRIARLQDPEFLRDGACVLVQELMELEVSQHLVQRRQLDTLGHQRLVLVGPLEGVGYGGGYEWACSRNHAIV